MYLFHIYIKMHTLLIFIVILIKMEIFLQLIFYKRNVGNINVFFSYLINRITFQAPVLINCRIVANLLHNFLIFITFR